MPLAYDDQTIVALATARGSGALAVIRLSGDDSFTVADSMASLVSGLKIREAISHSVHLGNIHDGQGNIIDQVMFVVMRAPKTFTGQHVVEITCHNNPFIISEIIERALICGARLALEGEFCKRAVLNKKIDLVQAEGINELIHATSRAALKTALAQVAGSCSQLVREIEENLIKALAFSEASFEFLDEEMRFDTHIKTCIDNAFLVINSIKRGFNQQKTLKEGFRVVLLGSVNAGKSSLFNELVGSQRSIVTNIPGTTRDTVESFVCADDLTMTFVDTAGLRKTDDVIEQEGIKRSFKEAETSDLILLTIDGSREIADQENVIYQDLLARHRPKTIVVYTKADLPTSIVLISPEFFDSINVSVVSHHNVAALHKRIASRLMSLFESASSPFLVNQRQYNLVLQLERHLTDVSIFFGHDTIPYELVSYHLTEAISTLSEVTGKTVSEAGMDAVFREFCVGK